MIQKKLIFIVVVFGLLLSGGVSGRPGDGKWTLQGCCDIERVHECWGPTTYPDQATCLGVARQGIAECRAGAAEHSTKEHKLIAKITGGCTYDGNEEDARNKCLNSCATFYICTWENGMCIKRINPEDDYINDNNPLHINQPSTTSTLSKLGDNEKYHPADALEQKHRCLDHCPQGFDCSYESGSGCTQTPKPKIPDPLEQKRRCLDNCPADFVCSYESGNGCTQTPKSQNESQKNKATTPNATSMTMRPGKGIENLSITPYQSYENKSKYCGPENHPWVMALIPRGPPSSGVDFNSGCYNHDECYSQCKITQDSKDFCDQQFGNDLNQICQTKFPPAENSCAEKGWYNPLKYTCLLGKSIGETYCYGSARTYQFAVSKFANCFNAYPCYVDQHPWIPCI